MSATHMRAHRRHASPREPQSGAPSHPRDKREIELELPQRRTTLTKQGLRKLEANTVINSLANASRVNQTLWQVSVATYGAGTGNAKRFSNIR